MTAILERGDIFFLYRPRVGTSEVHGVEGIQRLFVVLHSRERMRFRLLVVGRKRLPDVDGHERAWAYVDRVASDTKPILEELAELRYTTRTRGVRVVSAARPAGEGVYAIVEHDDHTHLAYALELPPQLGKVQRDLRIKLEASYIVAVRNPVAPWRSAMRTNPAYPEEMQARFGDHRFAPLAPDFLDHVGTELVMIATSEDVRSELGLELDIARESTDTAEIFTDLALDRKTHLIEPLVDGNWL